MLRRRAFLKRAGAVSLAVSATGPFIHASDKTGSKAPVIGSGEHRYECHHGWGEFPDTIHPFETHNVAVDGDGLVYITHRAGSDRPTEAKDAQDTVAVFDPEGRFIRSFGKDWHGGGHGIDIRREDGQEFLYLCEMFPINLVIKTDLKGEVVWIKDRSDANGAGVYDDPQARFSPTNVAFDPSGGFYVADGYGSNYVHQFDRDGAWVRTWGGTGTEPGKMQTPHGIWLDARRPNTEPTVLVADRANARLQRFTLDGRHLEIIDDVLFPAHFDVRGEILLVPDLHARVSLFDTENRAIVHLGDDPEWIAEVKKLEIRRDPARWEPGRFVHPHDACFDHDGNIFVTEWVVPGRVSFLRRVG